MTTREAINRLRENLAGVYDPREIESMTRIILEEVLLWKPVDIVMRDNEELPAFFEGKLNEILVDMIVDQNPGSDLRVLDIGTGSGCIAISLARALKFAHVTATDISPQALAVAQQNAAALKTRVSFVQQDILTTQAPREAWDIIVSNPPYITMSERSAMERNVLDYEPGSALFVPDDNPMLYYRPIAAYASLALPSAGRLYLEINRAMGSQVVQTLQQAGLKNIQLHNDFNGNPRFATATK